MARIVVAIPARWGSTRFPGKALHPICGRPLLWWVVRRAQAAQRPSEVLVATDDPRIFDAVTSWGVRAVMTSAAHPSGTDRIAEAIAGMNVEGVVNVQGDEPLVEPALIDQLADAIVGPNAAAMATAAVPLTDPELLHSPSVVKVVLDAAGHALYFSRAVIPFDRDRTATTMPVPVYRRHVGIYAYRTDALRAIVRHPPCELEKLEKLEQLRALYLGVRIRVIDWHEEHSVGVDTPEDVPRVEQLLRAKGWVPG